MTAPMKRHSTLGSWLGTVLLTSVATFASADPGEQVDTGELVEGIVARLQESYVFPEVAEAMGRELRVRAERGDYDALGDGKVLADTLTAQLRRVSHDTHLGVHYSRDPLPPMSEAAEEREQTRSALARINFGFLRLERLQGNVGYLDLDSFVDPDYGGETAASAMNFLSACDALIVDLRYNPGGDGRMVTLLCSYLFEGDPVHLIDIYSRPDDFTMQKWTSPHVPGRRFVGKDVYILTSRRTHSAAEEFAYVLQSLGRATVVGETSKGGAHPTARYRVTEHFGMAVPQGRAIDPVSGANWEGVGVQPDIQVSADLALDTAHVEALERMRTKASSDQVRFVESAAQKAREKLRAAREKLEPSDATKAVESAQSPSARSTSAAELERYIGRYETPMGVLQITREGDRLLAAVDGESIDLREESSGHYFAESVGARFRFQSDASGRVIGFRLEMKGDQIDGRRIQ